MSITDSKLTDDILSLLTAKARLERNAELVQGQSVSFLMSELRNRGWRNLGRPADFESDIARFGFRVAEGHLWRWVREKYCDRARIVTV